MPKEVDSVLRYMSERLKQEPYISNSSSKLFLAEVAIVIMHILQKDGKFDLQINDCFRNYTDRVFDFSLKKIEATRNFNYFKEKEDKSLSLIFQDMLDMYFSKKEICSLMQQFEGVESIDNDYNIIFKEKDYSNLNITKQESVEEPFVINKQTKEQDILNYFNNKIKEGYYTDIYKLLVDFSVMMYRKGASSIDLSIPIFDDIIKYINKQIISKFWFHQLSSEQLIPRFSYCWKNAKFSIIKKAADALQIPYQITGERYNQHIKLVKEKGVHHNTEEDDDVKKVRDTSPIIEETPKESKATGEDVIKVSELEVIPYIYKDIESKLSELFDTSEIVILDEEIFLREINLLLCSQAWNNVYDLFGDIQYIIYNQKRLATYTNRTVNYNNIKLSQLEGRHAFFLRTFPKKLKLDTRQNYRKSYRDVWYNNYAVSTIERMGLLFEPIKSIDNSGKITLKPIHVSANEIIVDPPLKQQHSPDDVFEYMDQLNKMYDESRRILIQESDILFIHRRIAEKREWENQSICIASIAYILIRQFGLNNNKQYKLLNNLYRKSIVINAKYDLLFEDNNHEENINKTLGLLIREYGNKLITEFYNSLIDINMSDNDDNTLINPDNTQETISTVNTNQKNRKEKIIRESVSNNEKQVAFDDEGGENEKLLEMYEDSGGFNVKESSIVDLHKNLAQNGEWDNASQCVASIAYIIIRQMKFANSPNALKFSKLKDLYKECKPFLSEDGLKIEDSQHSTNLAIVKERLQSSCSMKRLVDFYRTITGLSYVKDDGTIYSPYHPKENIRQEIDHPEDDSQKNTEINPSEDEIPELDTSVKDDTEDPLNDNVNSGEEFEDIIDEELEDTEEEYFLEEEEVELDEDEEIEEIINDVPVKITFKYETRAERELADYWEGIFKDGYYDTYIWKNKITKVEYCKIKDNLKSCIKDPQRKDGFAKRFAKALVLYCAEWYKREYNGNDGQGNPLDAIGLNLRTKDLWRWAEIDNRLLYGNEYLESIYTLGGLPINYIVKKKYEDTVMQELSDLFNNKTTEDSSKEKIFKKNNTIQYSLRNHNGSWYKLFNTIGNAQEYPLAESDSTDGIIKKFIEALKNQPIKRDKFSIDWIIETSEYTPLIRRKIRLNLNPETNGTLNNCIPDYKLGDEFNGKDEFNLYLCFYGENDDEEEQIGDLEGYEHIRFVNDYNGYFIGENVQDYFIFSEIPIINISKIKIIAKSRNDKYVELQEIEVAPYLELYKTWKYCTYSTKRNLGDKYILLPFDYQIQNGATSEDTPKYFTANGTKYRFTKVNGQFKFTDFKGNEVPIYEQNNKIEVSSPLHSDTFIYNDEKYFTRVVKDENGVETTEPVMLIFGKSDIICTQYYDGAEPKVIEEEDVIIKFKKENETFYTEWTNDSQPEQGYIKLQVNVQNRKILLNAYFIPSDKNPFKRNCSKEEIIVANSLNIINADVDLQTTTNSSNQTIARITRTDREKYYYDFKIGSANDYIIIPVIKPLDITELFKDGEFVKEYKNERMANIRIPIQFKDKYSLRKYDKNGFVSHYLRYDDVDMLDFKFVDDETSLDQTIEKETPAGVIVYYLCTDKKNIGTLSVGYKLGIGEKGVNNYKFYFWDMNLDNDPYPIDCDYDNGMLDLHTTKYPDGVIFQSLQGNICPRHYFKPILTTHDQKWPKDFESESVCAKCFEIASLHNVPFRIFAPLYWLLKDTDTRLVDLFALLVCNNQVTEQKLKDLVRLSNEFYFAWPFINISAWRQYKKEYDRLDGMGRGINKEQFEENLINYAKRLFCLYGTLMNQDDSSFAEKYANIYWYDKSVQFKFESSNNTNVWYAYNNGKDLGYDYFRNSIGSFAIRFMRAKKIISGDKRQNKKKRITNIFDLEYKRINKKIIIIGFTNNENGDEIRNVDTICRFLYTLKNENNPFMNILKFFEKYKIIHK